LRRELPLAAVLLVALASCADVAPPSARSGSSALSGQVTVFAASSLTDAFNRAGEQLKATHPGTQYTFSFGSSSTLATQIASGAPADVFASADEPSMQKVVDANESDGVPSYFAANRLEIAVAPGNPLRIAGLADLARRGVVVVLAGPTVPAGTYAREALSRAGVTVTAASEEVDVRAVLNKVALGEADAGIVYVTDVRSAGARVTGVPIAEEQQVVARYPVVVLRGAKNRDLARAYVEYLLSARGQALLAELGFSRP
jgi:molybdate transport system substrate-binding protein